MATADVGRDMEDDMGRVPNQANDDTDYDLINRIAKIMDQISENLEDYELTRFVNIIKEVGDNGREDDEARIENLVVDFTNLTMFRRGISVNLIKQAVRSLMEMQLDARLWKPVWDKVSRIAGKLNFSIIADFGELDEETLKKYLEVLKFGIENVRHIRLMVVGMFGVGKTTIIRRMCNEDAANVKSTVGIDVSVNACEVDDDREWRVTDVKKKIAKRDLHYKSRIKHANKKPKPAKKVKPQHIVAESAPVFDIEPEAVQTNTEHIIDESQYVDYQRFDEETEYLEELDTEIYSGETKEMEPKQAKSKFKIAKEVVMAGFVKGVEKVTKRKTSETSKFFDNLKDAVDEDDDQEPEKRITTVSIWDFAGQSIYYSTHHFFLSSRAIYLLVLNISKQLSDPVPEDELGYDDSENRATSMPKGFTCLDAFKFWMNSIYTYTAARQDGSTAYRPKIVLVGTFKDKLENIRNEEQYKENYFQEALESFKGSEVIKLVHKKKFFVSRDDPADVFNALKNELSDIAEKQVFWNEPVPVKWMPLERSIEIQKGDPFKATKDDETSDTCAIMELAELEKIDEETEYPLGDTDQLKVFLRFQHALGNVLYYDAKELEGTIILDPQWILNVFKLFVAHARDKEPALISEWQEFEKDAILSLSLIDELVKQSDEPTFTKYKTEIVQYMEHLDVIAKPVTYIEERTEESSSDEEDDEEQPWQNKTEDFYIVPCLLSLKPTEEQLKCKIQPTDKSTPILCLVFNNNFLPAFVCHRLMATCIRQWEVKLFEKKQRMVFNGMGGFLLNASKTSWLSLWWKDHIIYMQIFLRTGMGKPVDGKTCSKVKAKIQQMIQRIFSIHRKFTGEVGENQKVQYTEYIKCPVCHSTPVVEEEDGGDEDEMTRIMLVKQFLKHDEVSCDHGHTMSRDAALSRWYFKKNEEQKIQKLRELRREVFHWFRENADEDEITDRHIAELASSIGREYIALGIELGLTFTEIEHIQMEERNVKVCIKTILLKWRQSCIDTPTIGSMKKAIMNILGIYHKDGKFRQKLIDKKIVVSWFDAKMKPAEREVNPDVNTTGDVNLPVVTDPSANTTGDVNLPVVTDPSAVADQPAMADSPTVADTPLEVDPPSEQDLLQVTHFVDGNYRRLAKRLFKEMPFVELEHIEDSHSLDFNRVLAVLLLWQKTGSTVSFAYLKEVVMGMLKIDWLSVRREIEAVGPSDERRDDDPVLRPEGTFEDYRDAEYRQRREEFERQCEQNMAEYMNGDMGDGDMDGEAYDDDDGDRRDDV